MRKLSCRMRKFSKQSVHSAKGCDTCVPHSRRCAVEIGRCGELRDRRVSDSNAHLRLCRRVMVCCFWCANTHT